MKVPGNDSSRELSFNFRSWGTEVLHRDLSFLGTKGLGYEKSVVPGESSLLDGDTISALTL